MKSKIGKCNETSRFADSNPFKRKLIVNLFVLAIYIFKNFIEAKRNRTDAHACHDVEQEFRHFYLQTVAVASDNLPQGFRLQQLRVEPHSAFFFGG